MLRAILYAFSPVNLADLLNQAGFSVDYHTTQIGGYLNFVKSIRFFMAAKRTNPSLAQGITGLLSNVIVRAVMAPLFALKDMHMRGSEMVVVAVKTNRLNPRKQTPA